MASSPATSSSLAARIYERAHLTGEFRLRSGVVSREYFDKYLFEADPKLLHEVAEALVGLLPEGVEVLAGLELGGVPLATVASQVSGLPTVFVRKDAKKYGTCRLAEGGEVAGRRLAVVEDVVTSGGQVIDSCRTLRERGAEVAAVLCVIDREAGGADNLAAETLELRSVFTMTQLRRAGAAYKAEVGNFGPSRARRRHRARCPDEGPHAAVRARQHRQQALAPAHGPVGVGRPGPRELPSRHAGRVGQSSARR